MTIQVGTLEQNIPGKMGLYKGRAVLFWSKFSCSVVTTAQVQKQGQTVVIFLERTVDHYGPQTLPDSFWEPSFRKLLCAPWCCIRHKETPPGRDLSAPLLTWRYITWQTFWIVGPHSQWNHHFDHRLWNYNSQILSVDPQVVVFPLHYLLSIHPSIHVLQT